MRVRHIHQDASQEHNIEYKKKVTEANLWYGYITIGFTIKQKETTYCLWIHKYMAKLYSKE